MVHPAPRMMSAPVPNRSMYFSGTDGGALSAYEAIVIDQAARNFAIAMVSPHHGRRNRARSCRGRTAGVE